MFRYVTVISRISSGVFKSIIIGRPHKSPSAARIMLRMKNEMNVVLMATFIFT